MLITVISIFVAFILIIIFRKKLEMDRCGIIFGTIFIGIVLSLLAHLFTIPASREISYVTIERPIVASKTDSRINGEIRGGFFYVKGKIEEKDYYFVLSKRGNNIYKQMNVPVESTTIVETNGTPRVKLHKRYAGCKWSRWVRFHDDKVYVDEKDTIFVPIGTIENSIRFEVF